MNGLGLPHQTPPIPAPETSIQGRHVLLAEDNAINRELASALLRKLGLRVTVAVNGLEAVERATTERFDLVLMDIQMPLMDGLEATRRIREHEGRRHGGGEQVTGVQVPAHAAVPPTPLRPLPILAMTAHASAEDRMRCLAAGMNDHLIKPIDPGRLADAVDQWMSPATEPLSGQPADQSSRPPPAETAPRSEPRLAEDPAEQPVAAGLPLDLPPFDIPAALQRCNGSHALLCRLITGFAEHFSHAGQRMRALISAGQWVEAKDLAHSLTGVAASLELRALTDVARLIDADLSQARYELLPARVCDLEATLDQAVRAALSVPIPIVDATPDRTPGGIAAPDHWEQDADLEEFRRHLCSNSFTARRDLARITPHLHGRGVDAELAIIARGVDRLDFATAAAALDQLIARLRTPTPQAVAETSP